MHGLAIGFTAVENTQNGDLVCRVVDGIDEAVIACPEAPTVDLTGEFNGSWGARIVC
jgi:hypothetical protein